MMNLSPVLFLAILLVACTPTRRLGTIKFSPKEPNNYLSEELKQLIKDRPNAAILVRSDDASYLLSEQESYLTHRIFGAIEKELIISGFEVRDRGLFETILSKTTENDYEGIAKATNTDLILELTGLDFDIEYNTNKYINKKGNVVTVQRNIRMYGIQFKFKIVDVANNKVAGIHEYNIAPCMNGCRYYIDRTGNVYRNTTSVDQIEPYEFVQVDDIEVIMSVGTSGLIKDLTR